MRRRSSATAAKTNSRSTRMGYRNEIVTTAVPKPETATLAAIRRKVIYPAGYATDLISVYWSNPATPFWRPTPLSL